MPHLSSKLDMWSNRVSLRWNGMGEKIFNCFFKCFMNLNLKILTDLQNFYSESPMHVHINTTCCTLLLALLLRSTLRDLKRFNWSSCMIKCFNFVCAHMSERFKQIPKSVNAIARFYEFRLSNMKMSTMLAYRCGYTHISCY